MLRFIWFCFSSCLLAFLHRVESRRAKVREFFLPFLLSLTLSLVFKLLIPSRQRFERVFIVELHSSWSLWVKRWRRSVWCSRTKWEIYFLWFFWSWYASQLHNCRTMDHSNFPTLCNRLILMNFASSREQTAFHKFVTRMDTARLWGMALLKLWWLLRTFCWLCAVSFLKCTFNLKFIYQNLAP